jgi:hypothetical protein
METKITGWFKLEYIHDGENVTFNKAKKELLEQGWVSYVSSSANKRTPLGRPLFMSFKKNWENNQ